jgi:hypothetical protein
LAEERGLLVAGDRAPAWRSRRDRELVDAPGTKTGPRVVGLSAVAIDWEKWEGAMVAAAEAAMEEAIGGSGGAKQTSRKDSGIRCSFIGFFF